MSAKVKSFALRMSPSTWSEIEKLTKKGKSANSIILDALDIYLGNMSIQSQTVAAIAQMKAEQDSAMKDQDRQLALLLIGLEALADRAGAKEVAEFLRQKRGSKQ